jgi:DNA-binding NarL/FixJ family response regulator
VSELERHLWRIAAEVEASGILLRMGSASSLALRRHPGAASLSPKQWEILRRIVGGERVPTIAQDLYVSQSTVRNHLSAIFDRFGVHSQVELLALLAKTDVLPSQTDALSMS